VVSTHDPLGWHHIIPQVESWLSNWWIGAHKRVVKPQRRPFDSVVLLTTRTIWLERDGRVFNRVPPPLHVVARSILVVLDEWCHVKLVSWLILSGE
jgi:hypothetical protein